MGNIDMCRLIHLHQECALIQARTSTFIVEGGNENLPGSEMLFSLMGRLFLVKEKYANQCTIS